MSDVGGWTRSHVGEARPLSVSSVPPECCILELLIKLDIA